MAELTTTGLRVLVAVAERGSFTAAAAVLGYTQSAVSRQVASLEAAAGQSLFDRHRAGVTLTAAGNRLLPRAARIVADLDAALSDVASGTAGRVRFGTFPMAAAGLVPPVLAALAGCTRTSWSPCVSRARPPWCGRSGPAPSTWPWSRRPRPTDPWTRSRPRST